jgi:hypothetical protein
MYGLIKKVLSLCMNSVTGKKRKHLRKELDRRLDAFDYPIGWVPFTFPMLRTVNSNHSMELFRKAGTICVHIFRGLHFLERSCISSGYIFSCLWYIYIYIYPNRLYHVGIIPDELLKLLDQIMKVVWLLYGPDTGPDDLEEIQQEVRLHALIHILVYLYSDLTYIIRVCPYV